MRFAGYFYLVWLWAPCVAAEPPEARLMTCQERLQKEQFRQIVNVMATGEEFAKLEQLGQELLSNKTRFPDGQPKLEVFYEQASSSETRSNWPEALTRQNRWVASYPRSARAKIARANFYVSYAWNARGSGYSNTVKEKDWKLFRERLALAEQDLLQAQKDDPSDPYGYVTCITIAMANGWKRDRVDALVARALAVFPNCDSAIGREAYYLTPRWQGEPGDVEKFADQWSAKNKAFYSIAWESVEGLSDIMDETHFSWPKLKASYEARMKDSPSEILKNRYARDANRFGDKETALKLVRELKYKWDPYAWKQNKEQFNQLRHEAGLLSK